MSTRAKVPWLSSLIIAGLFALAALPAYIKGPTMDYYISSDAEAGMRRNTSAQTVCAHLNTTAGADHISGTVNVYYHNNSSFVSLGTATHQNLSAGIWCYSLTADSTNYDLVKVLWQSTGAITLLQTYPTVGWDESAAYVPANVTHVTGTAQASGRVDANITHINGTAQSGGVVDTDVDAIVDEIELRHGTGPYTK